MTGSTEHDFDFLTGHWQVQHQRLVKRLAGSDEWQRFGGTCDMHLLLGGHGNVDDNVLDLPAGSYRAATLRTFDANTRRWAIWWFDGRQPHAVDRPLVGGFDDGSGLFYAEDQFEGRAIRVRFRWLETRSGAPLWEQAYSADGGLRWEVNWTMRFRRSAGHD